MEKRFVSIWFPHLQTDWLSRAVPKLINQPFVISTPVHGRMTITAASPAAQTLGICRGMVLADARAVCPSLQSFDEKPGLSEKLLKRIAAWCIRFTPIAAIDLPDGIQLDASGCSHLWGSEQEYLADILKRLREKGFQARAGIAGSFGCAWGVARFGNTLVIPPGEQTNAILSLPAAALRLDASIIARMHQLGLHQVKDFISMPKPALRRRFGQQVLQRIAQATGLEQEQVRSIHPPQDWQERLPCLEPVQRLEGIEIALQQLLEQLCRRFQKEAKGIRKMSLKIFRVDNKTQSIGIDTTAPSSSVKHLFHLFSLKLQTLEPGLGIELFLLEANTVEPLKALQGEYWKNASGINNTVLAELVDRISARLGPAVVSRYLPAEHHWPERSFSKANALDAQSPTQWRTDQPRPIILLPVPEKIEVTAPIPDYPPMLFRHKGKLHKIVRADGPERIEQEWWLQQGQHRDYYAVEDENGCRYWLFRSGHYDAEKTWGWYLHGYFT